MAECLTIATAARRAGIGARQLRGAIARGELASYRIGAWSRVRWREVLAWIDQQRVPLTQHAEQRVAEILAKEARD